MCKIQQQRDVMQLI